MPRFEAPPPLDPTMPHQQTTTFRPALPPRTQPRPTVPPPPGAVHHRYPPPPYGMGWPLSTDAYPVRPTTPAGLGAMTRGWAWTALLLMALIPIGIVFLSVMYIVASIGPADPQPDEAEAEWFGLVAGYLLLAWGLLSTVGAATSAVIGAVRARLHPELPRAPVVSVLVWVLLGLMAFGIVRAIANDAF